MVDEKSGVHLNPEELNESLELPDDDLPTPKLGSLSPLKVPAGSLGDSGRALDRSVYVKWLFT